MRSIQYLVNKLTKDYPNLCFDLSDDFFWSASAQTVFYNPQTPHSKEYILHELSHAILGHHTYRNDIDLIKLERDAWEYAKSELAPKYKTIIHEETIQDNLDTYREWLYARSTCPECNTTGIETRHQGYRCFACGHSWRANEAKLCALRRYSSLKTK